MKITLDESNGLKVLSALLVFFCHCSPIINMWGFVPVGCFFFLSGYGTFYSNKNPINRIIKFLFIYCLIVCLYSSFKGSFWWNLPFCWFFLIYAIQQIFYRFFHNWKLICLLDFILSLILWRLGFNYPWYTSMILFPLGLAYANGFSFSRRVLSFMFLIGLLLFFYSYGFPLLMWCLSIPAVFIMLHYKSVYSPLCKLGYLTLPFYLIHCLFLNLCGVRTELGFNLLFGSVSISIILSFIGSVCGAFLLHKFISAARFL